MCHVGSRGADEDFVVVSVKNPRKPGASISSRKTLVDDYVCSEGIIVADSSGFLELHLV